jgi:hypothetical protein
MNIPPKNNVVWKDIVTGKKTFTLKFLAAKILLGRLVASVKKNNTPENIQDAVEQLHTIYEKNKNAPSVQDDIKTIFG